MLSDQELLRRLLARADHPHVKLLPETRKITSAQALRMARRGDFEFGGSRHRVRWMRPAKPRLPWVHCYRTTGAASLPPSIEWCSSRRSRAAE